MSADSNAAAATPRSLFDMYSKHAAATGNPCTMRSIMTERGLLDEHEPLLRGRFLGAVLPSATPAGAPKLRIGRAPATGNPSVHSNPLTHDRLPPQLSCGAFRPLQLCAAPGCAGGALAPPPTAGVSRAEEQIRNAVRGARVGNAANAQLGVAMYMPVTNGLSGGWR